MAVPKRLSAPLAELTVIESRPVGESVLAVVDAVQGSLTTGMRLLAKDRGEVWEVRGIAFAPIQATELGRIGIVLAPIGHRGNLPSGVQLAQVWAAAAAPII